MELCVKIETVELFFLIIFYVNFLKTKNESMYSLILLVFCFERLLVVVSLCSDIKDGVNYE